MRINFQKFKGRPPYATELIGVYQPLIGWKSALTKARLAAEPFLIPGLAHPVRVLPHPESGIEVQIGQDYRLHINADETFQQQAGEPDLFTNPSETIRFRPPEYLDSLIVRFLQDETRLALTQHEPTEDVFWSQFWRDHLSADSLKVSFVKAVETLIHHTWLSSHAHIMAGPNLSKFDDYIIAARHMFPDAKTTANFLFNKEAHVARFLNDLLPAPGQNPADIGFPRNANDLLLKTFPALSLHNALDSMRSLGLATGPNRDVLLSPIGIVHLFRQYFFEFENFLGTPVEHIWLSPGSTTELIEVSTRRVLQERTIEQMMESIFRNETSITTEDELSQAIKSENQRDTKLGSSVSGGATILIASIEASGSASVEETAKHAREQTHRETRQQSAKLSSEIRTNFKSTFKTVVETTDMRSRRYVIENKSNKLRNYELRRKMRQVGIQMQDIGTQLCWQVYVDDPGRELGVAQLVHLASRSDLSEFNHLPEKPVPKGAEEIVTLLVPIPRPGQRSDMGPIAAAGFLGLMAGGVPGVAAGVAAYEVLDGLFGGDDEEEHSWYTIKPETHIHQPFKLTLPQGYQIAATQKADEQFPIPALGQIPLRWFEQNGSKNLAFHMTVLNASDGTMDMVINGGDVTPGEIIEFQAKIAIAPTQTNIDAVAQHNGGVVSANKDKDIAKERKLKDDLVNGVKERVKFASEIKARVSEDLRSEERIVIYRRLIAQLMREDAWNLKADRKVAHLRSELIKAIFDVDRMLYFVAPEWWQPRLHQSSLTTGVDMPDTQPVQKTAVAKQSAVALATAASLSVRAKQAKLGQLGNTDLVGWGGEGRGDNYLITENSQPARLGSSLGWLLQLDGDNLRNAFLNAPWVKAVIPIRPGRESEALDWLKQSNVEGTDGLNTNYAGNDVDHFADKLAARGIDRDPTNEDVPNLLAEEVTAKNDEGLTPVEEEIREPQGAPYTIKYLPPEEVFEKGFDPLPESFRARDEENFKRFTQWVEILPTDQIVAVEVEYDAKTGFLK